MEAAKGGQAPPLSWLYNNIFKAPDGAKMRGVLPNEWLPTKFDPEYTA